MNRTRIAAFVCFVVVGMVSANAPAAEGRYQLAVGSHGDIYVIDTSTGQCWSKDHDKPWIDHGIPQKAESKKTRAPLSLKLPEERVTLTLSQRHEKALPGSQDRIALHLGDITGGQVEVAVKTDEGMTLLDDTSMERGDVADFRVGKKTFYLRLRELKNFLVGEDLAILELSANRPTDKIRQDSEIREKKKAEEAEGSQEHEETEENI